MGAIDVLADSIQANRKRTLSLYERILQEGNGSALGWRPGPGRAHMAWQFMHIGITEEVFATDRLNPERPKAFTELWPRYRGGSTPDDIIPTESEIRTVLEETRVHLIDTLSGYVDEQLGEIPPGLKERGWTLRDALHILSWHESHHQGQAHLTYNLYCNR